METFIHALGQAQTIEEAKGHLYEGLKRLLVRERGRGRHDPFREQAIHRIEVPLEDDTDPLAWLRQQSSAVKTYWSDRHNTFRMAGIGVTHAVSGRSPIDFRGFFSLLNRTLSASHPNVRYYGGLRFDQTQAPDDSWDAFSDYRFIVPRFEVISNGGKTLLACNIRGDQRMDAWDRIGEWEDALDRIHACHLEDAGEFTLPEHRPEHREDIPDRDAWCENVRAVLTMFEQGELQKIVLARKSVLTFDHELEPVSLLQRIYARNSHAFHFCFQPDEGRAFIGVSPELLYSRYGHEIYSEAIAGTRARGRTPEEDRRLGQELLTSEKELREHRWVSEMVTRGLSPLCVSMDTLSRETLLPLSHVQHLYSRFHGGLREGIGDADIVTALHPTPAVGGSPKDASMRRIAALEPFDRGWYAGPVGWISRDAAQFSVGIRSALVSGNTLSLFAGAGIVQGSDPHKEWEENENKLLNFTGLFQCT